MDIRLKVMTAISQIVLIVLGLSFQIASQAQNSSHKFHPGHYVAVGPYFDLSEIRHLSEPAIQGVNKRYLWRTLEPVKGAYDLSWIEQDLEYCATHGKQLVVFLCDKSFWIKGAMPGYLKDYECTNPVADFVPYAGIRNM